MIEKTEVQASRREGKPLIKLWRLLASVKFAVAIFSILSIVAFAGFFVPQHPDALRISEMKKLLGNRLIDVLGLLRIFDIYGSIWFKILL